MITLLQLPTGLVVILMMYLQVWNCNRVVPTRQRLSGMTFQTKMGNCAFLLVYLPQIPLQVQEKLVKIIIKMKISSLQVIKETLLAKNQVTKIGMVLLTQLRTVRQRQVILLLLLLIQVMVKNGSQMVRFLRILSGIIVQYQVFFQHGAGGRLQQGKTSCRI